MVHEAEFWPSIFSRVVFEEFLSDDSTSDWNRLAPSKFDFKMHLAKLRVELICNLRYEVCAVIGHVVQRFNSPERVDIANATKMAARETSLRVGV